MNDLENLLASYTSPSQLADEFVPAFYRAVQNDLRAFDDADLARHYANHGRSEGRLASPAAHRVGFLSQISHDAAILEIGPGFYPAFRGPNVVYFDTFDGKQLVERAIAEGVNPSGCPNIDYVSPTGDLSVVTSTFDLVFSSHCIEHQPDLVYHLQCVERLLKPGGRYYLIIPDMRFCFDAQLDESDVDEVLVAHKERRTAHTWANVHDHYARTTHNDANRHWRGDHEDPRFLERTAREQAAREKYEAAAGGYVDVHAWKFTPDSFRRVVTELNRGDKPLIALGIERLYDTAYGRPEFCCVLGLAASREDNKMS